jgi:phosphatidylserine/phosphatidylglycerophosphate/cardiolipin synthase-like enzyme
MHKRLYENVEFSFGKGVGSKIYDAINNAKHSVFILTPYISQGYIDFLLRKKQEGINVSLVTTPEAQKGKMDEIYKKILLQHCVTDEKKLAFKDKAKRWCLLVGVVALMIGLAGLFWHGFHRNFHSVFKKLKWFWHDDSALILSTVCVIFISSAFYKMFHRIKVFSYFYSTRFPFVVVPSIYSTNIRSIAPMLDSFVHAKIYVIDDSDIFIGSANLTKSGLRHNIESFIKIYAHDAVKEITAEIDTYLYAHCRPITINHLGACLYHEAPY